MRAMRRRLLSFSAVFGASVGLGLTAPLWIPSVWLIGLLRRRRFVGLRLALFAWLYATMESLGLLRAGLAWLVHRPGEDAFFETHYRIQRWWSGTLFDVMRRLLGASFQVEGAEALSSGGPVILLMRHTSIVDSLLPAALVTNAHGIRLRYVLKRELLADPCLDVVGHRLPNWFLDRGNPTETDLEAIRGLATDLGPQDGVVIYPEGTRFSDAKRDRILARLRERHSPHLAKAEALLRTLPPRLGGVAALLDAAPGVDVVVCAHEGLDRFVGLKDILSGALVGATIRVAFWRIDRARVPHDATGRTEWLYEQWSRVDTRARAA